MANPNKAVYNWRHSNPRKQEKKHFGGDYNAAHKFLDEKKEQGFNTRLVSRRLGPHGMDSWNVYDVIVWHKKGGPELPE